MADISIDQLAAEITDAVREYTEDVAEAIEHKVDEAANEVRDEAEREAPKRTGKYAKGFKVSKQDSKGVVRRTVWNKKYSRLVHLLEFGHAKRGGGRVAGKAHLRPAYDNHVDRLQEDIKRIIQNGGGT